MALCKRCDANLNKMRKETLFIQILEGLHKSEADLLINVKERN